MNIQSTPKTLITYDYLEGMGGAERVSLHLIAETFPDADLLVAYIDTGYDLSGLEHRIISLLDEKPKPSRFFSFQMIWLFIKNRRRIRGYERIVAAGYWAPLMFLWGDTRFYYYCHSPPRITYDLFDYLWQSASLIRKGYLLVMKVFYNFLYRRSIAKATEVLANSENVRARLRKYCGIESSIVYPPVKVIFPKSAEKGNFYLSFGRLDELKRIDCIIDSFKRHTDKRLIICSEGSDRPRLEEMADGYSNIEFRGNVSDRELFELTSAAIATLYVPMDEDFGMSPVESMMLGTPVIGVDSGGIRETVQHGVTGLLCSEPPTGEKIADMLAQLTNERALAMAEPCRSAATRFSAERFDQEMRSGCTFSVDAPTQWIVSSPDIESAESGFDTDPIKPLN